MSGKNIDVTKNADGKAPVCLALMATRTDPARPDVINYRVCASFAWAANTDEARGIGHRLADELWPTSEGWAASVSICWLSSHESAAIAATVAQAASKGGA